MRLVKFTGLRVKADCVCRYLFSINLGQPEVYAAVSLSLL